MNSEEFESDWLITTYRIADLAVSRAAVLALGLLIGTVLGAFLAFSPGPAPQGESIVFTVYPSGSPSYSAAEIIEQIRVRLTSQGIAVGAASGGVMVPADMSGRNESAASLVQQVVDTVDHQATKTRLALSGRNDDAATQSMIRYDAYLDGRSSGLIELVSQTVVASPPPKSRMIYIPTGAILGLIAAYVVAAAFSWLRGYAEYRAATRSISE